MELQTQYEAFQEVQTELIALAVAPVASVNGVQQLLGVTYPMLADPTHQVAEAYGVYNLLGDGLATPAVFIIDTDGHVVWSYVGSHSNDRPSTLMILDHLP